MPTAFQLVLGAVALLALGALFLVGRRLVRVWLAYRGTRVVVCPENQQTAAIEVDARHAALSAAQRRAPAAARLVHPLAGARGLRPGVPGAGQRPRPGRACS